MYNARTKYKFPFNRYGLTKGILIYAQYAFIAIVAAVSLAALVLLLLLRPIMFFCGLGVLFLAVRGVRQRLSPNFLSFSRRRRIKHLPLAKDPMYTLFSERQVNTSLACSGITKEQKEILDISLAHDKVNRETAFMPGWTLKEEEEIWKQNILLKSKLRKIESILNDREISADNKASTIRNLLADITTYRHISHPTSSLIQHRLSSNVISHPTSSLIQHRLSSNVRKTSSAHQP